MIPSPHPHTPTFIHTHINRIIYTQSTHGNKHTKTNTYRQYTHKHNTPKCTQTWTDTHTHKSHTQTKHSAFAHKVSKKRMMTHA